MDLKKFRIVSPRDVQSTDNVYESLLLNINHVVSVKPIKMVIEDKVINGYWVRTTNGKKYRAVEIPSELATALNEQDKDLAFLGGSSEAKAESQFLN